MKFIIFLSYSIHKEKENIRVWLINMCNRNKFIGSEFRKEIHLYYFVNINTTLGVRIFK